MGQEDFYEITLVDFQAIPDAAVDEEAMASLSFGDESGVDGNAFDPALDWDEATAAEGFGDVGGDIDGAIYA